MEDKEVEASAGVEREDSGGGVRSEKGSSGVGEFVPPDGGYGWVVVVAAGLFNFFVLPLIQNFGLIYKEILTQWDMNTAEYSFIMNFQFSVSNCVGLITGPLLRIYGYRKMTLWASIIVGISTILTSQVNKFHFFIITYSILGGIGMGFGWSATALAINTYFKRRRGIATGFTWTATGLSPVVFPFLVTWLMRHFDVHGTVLILSGLMLHSIPAALLLHPVEWHTKRVVVKQPPPEETPTATETDEMRVLMEGVKDVPGQEGSRRNSNIRGRRTSQEGGDFLVDTPGTIGLDVSGPISRHSSRWSLASTGGRSRLRSFSVERISEQRGKDGAEVLLEMAEKLEAESVSSESSKKKSFISRSLSSVVKFFDLGLLRDPRFLMIFIGMTLAFCGEINFTLLVPFVLSDFGFPMDKVALFMSSQAFVDLITRFTVPFVTDSLQLDSRLMYSIGITILAIGRMMLAHLSGFYTILCVTLWLGFGKGLRTVYMALVMPSVVPLDRLAAASGLQMLANGILFLMFGPLFGYLRDSSGNFMLALYSINVMTFGAILIWIVEVLYTRSRRRRDALKREEE